MGEPWFGAKTYGMGLSPRSPAGWIATAVYVAAMGGVVMLIRVLPHWLVFVILGVLTVAFVILTIVKSDGQPWRWRWGGR